MHEGLVLRLHGVGERLPVAAVYVGDQPLECHVVDALAPLAFVVDFYLSAFGSVDQNVVNLRGILLERRVQIEVVFLRQRVQDGAGEAPFFRAGLPAQHGDGSLVDA